MLRTLFLTAALASAVAAPARAAEVDADWFRGSRGLGAGALVYWSVPLGGMKGQAPQAGFALRLRHEDARSHLGQRSAREVDALDLRLGGRSEPTLFVLRRPVIGDKGDRRQIAVGEPVAILVAAAAAVGAYLLYEALKDDEDSFCLDPGNPLCKIPSQ